MQLNEEQRRLAEENHNLIYGYLQKRGLDVDEYYDICAIGLCKAVKAFDPTQGKKLATLAYRVMDNEVKQYWRRWNFKGREQERFAVSLSDPVYHDAIRGELTLGGTLQGPGDDGRSPYYIVACRTFVDSLPAKEQKVIQMRMNGWTVSEIGHEVGVSTTWVSKLIARVRQKYIAETAV